MRTCFVSGGVMNKLSKYSVLVLPLVFAANTALGAGFGLYEFSARGNAMGGAVLAGEAEPASLALNPALITDLKGSQVQLGATLVTARARVTYDGQTTDPEHAFWVLPNFYYTQQINEDWYAGIGMFTRFGLSNEYDDRTWKGAKNIYEVGVTSLSVQPTAAYKVTDRLSASAGVEVMYFDFMEGKRIDTSASVPGSHSDMKIEGDSVGASPILALAYKANDKVNFGTSFRFRTKQSLEGTAKYYDTASPLLAAFKNGDVTGDITLPAQLAMGVSYKPTDDLLVEFNWMNIFWSSFDAISIDYDHTPGTGLPGEKTDKKEWKDTYRIGLGAEYTLTSSLKLRGSYIFDKSPVNNDYMDVLVPVNDRHLFGTGLGWKVNDRYTVDLSYTYLLGTSLGGHTDQNASVEPNKAVSYKNGSSQLAGISVKYTF